MAYQRDAIMRVVMPEGPNTTNLHCDADYHHPPAEVIIIILTIIVIIFIINFTEYYPGELVVPIHPSVRFKLTVR